MGTDILRLPHKRLKAKVRLLENNRIPALDLEALAEERECVQSHNPNEATKKALKNAKEGKNLTRIDDLAALVKKFGL